MHPHLFVPATADIRRALATGFKLLPSSGMPVFSIALAGRSIIQASVALEKVLQTDKKKKAVTVRRVPGSDHLFWAPTLSRYVQITAGLDGTILKLVRPDALAEIKGHEKA